MGRPFSVNETINIAQKRAIARAAVELCKDGEPIIINGGTTTYQMVHYLTGRRLPVFTNSFAIAEHLLHNSRNSRRHSRRHGLSRAERHPVAVRRRRGVAISMPSACSSAARASARTA